MSPFLCPFAWEFELDAARRLRRIYNHSGQMDLFLRTGFRVGGTSARKKLDRLACDVTDGMDATDRLGPSQAMSACFELPTKRAVSWLFGIAAASAIGGAKSNWRLPLKPQWSFVVDLGTGFGARLNANRAENTAVLMGTGLRMAYWHWPQYVEQQTRVPTHPAVDRGLGAMIWLGSGADAMTAAAIAHSFSTERQPDIWKGLGFALSFLSDLCETRSGAVDAILPAGGPMVPFLVQGVTFGAFHRQQIDALDQQVEDICHRVAGKSAAALVRASLEGLANWDQ